MICCTLLGSAIKRTPVIYLIAALLVFISAFINLNEFSFHEYQNIKSAPKSDNNYLLVFWIYVPKYVFMFGFLFLFSVLIYFAQFLL